jgi:hypothetical protein
MYITKDLVNIILDYVDGDIPDEGTDFLEEHIDKLLMGVLISNQSIPRWFFKKHLKIDKCNPKSKLDYNPNVPCEFYSIIKYKFITVKDNVVVSNKFITDNISLIMRSMCNKDCSINNNIFQIEQSLFEKHVPLKILKFYQNNFNVKLELLDKHNVEYDYTHLSLNKSISFEYIDDNIDKPWSYVWLAYRSDIPMWFIDKHIDTFINNYSIQYFGHNKHISHDLLFEKYKDHPDIHIILFIGYDRLSYDNVLILKSIIDEKDLSLYEINNYLGLLSKNENIPLSYLFNNYCRYEHRLSFIVNLFSRSDITVEFIEKCKNANYKINTNSICRNKNIPLSYHKNNLHSSKDYWNSISTNEGITTYEGRKALIKEKLYSLFCAPRITN